MYNQNLHTHSTYCDGKDTLEEMVNSAISFGFSSIGFSSHCHTGLSFDECGIESLEKQSLYISELEKLNSKYNDKIRIYKGLEMESRYINTNNPHIDPRLDYSIGSIHLFWLEDQTFAVDNTPDEFLKAQEAFGGLRPLLESYYAELIRFASISNYDITGHVDLVTKFNEIMNWDFECYPWYIDAAIAATDALIQEEKIIEVNTGAISRGYRTSPYPAPFILGRIKEKKGRILLSSDCHDKNHLTEKFDETVAMLESIGFTELYTLTDEGFKASAISRFI